MNIDSNLILAIIAIIALLSPVITTLINNHFQIKLKKLDMYETSKKESISEFIEATEKYYYYRQNSKYIVEFEASINKLYIFFSIPNNKLFDTLKKCIKENDYNKTQYAISQIVTFLSTNIEK